MLVRGVDEHGHFGMLPMPTVDSDIDPASLVRPHAAASSPLVHGAPLLPGLPSNKMALITSDCGKLRSLSRLLSS